MRKTKFEIIPLGKQILIKPDEEESRQTDTGLYKPDTVEQERKAIGTIISIGPEVKGAFKKGDKVIYGVFAGDAVSWDGVDYKFIEEEFILGILKTKK